MKTQKHHSRMTTKNNHMELWEHLQELRKLVVISLISILLISVGALTVSDKLMKLLMKLLMSFSDSYIFTYTSPEMLTVIRLKISVLIGFVTAFPIIAVCAWIFIAPALRRFEKIAVITSAIFGTLLFAGGVIFAYTTMLPFMFRFFSMTDIQGINPYISISEYINFILTVLLIFGAIFEIPIIMVLLDRIGIVTRSTFKRIRKYEITAVFIIAALITPPDVFTMIITAVPMLLIYELGLGASWITNKLIGTNQLKKMEDRQ